MKQSRFAAARRFWAGSSFGETKPRPNPAEGLRRKREKP